MNIDYTQILLRKFADQEWNLDGDDYAGLNWISNTPKPEKSTLDAFWDEVKKEILAEIDAKLAAKVSGLAKLAALGLTENEIKEIF